MSRFGVTWLLMVLMFGGFIFLLAPTCHAADLHEAPFGWRTGIITANTGDYTRSCTYPDAATAYATYCAETIYPNGHMYILKRAKNAWWDLGTSATGWWSNGSFEDHNCPNTFTMSTTSSNKTITGFMETVVCRNFTTGDYHYIYLENRPRSDILWNGTLPAPEPPVCGYTDYSVSNSSIVPAVITVNDASYNATSFDWNVAESDSGDLYFTNNRNLTYTAEIPGMYIISHKVYNGTYGNSTCSDIVDFLRQNSTTPVINITTNITPPNWTPAIPTVPVTIPTIPNAINKTTARDAVNGTILGPYAEAYMDYWDTIDDGLISFINGVLDVILFPLTYATEQLSLPTTWLTEIALQYSEKSNNIVGIMIQSIYAFPPKLANLVTYGLLLDLILVVMHEVGEKK